MPATDFIEVTIIVPCRNERRFIRECLDSILQQDAQCSMEILIADGMSTDGTREILQEYAGRIASLRILDNSEKIASTGLNAAIREAGGVVIIRMDAHTSYSHDYVRNCLRVLHESGADNVGGPARTKAEGYLAGAIALAFQSQFACGGARFHDPHYEGYVDTVPYGCWRKTTLSRIGLFDETLVRNQDDELNARIVSSGGKIWQSPKIVSWYRPRTGLSSLFRQYFQYGYWKIATMRKHRRLASWRHLVPAASLALAVVLVLGNSYAKLFNATRLSSTLWIVMAILVGTYVAVSTGAALIAAARHGWRFLPVLPVVFAVYHLSYGLGFWAGLSTYCAPSIAMIRAGSLPR